MANLVKPKVGIFIFSIFVLILIPLLKSKFNAPVIFKQWKEKLSWNDFQGLPPIFSRYSAAINSKIFLELDSFTKEYHAYARQNNILSWVKTSDTSSQYLLDHEQYHFNITELHARIMNQYIAENPGLSFADYYRQLNLVNVDRDLMQNQYDEESHHSVNRTNQHFWEYRIDSLLITYSSDSGWITDNYARSSLYFASKPHFLEGVNHDNAFRGYYLNKYGMHLSHLCFQMTDKNDMKLIRTNLSDYYETRKLNIQSFKTELNNNELHAFVVTEDTVNSFIYHKWIINQKYTYMTEARFPDNEGDTIGYGKIARSFINSFRIANTDEYWLNQFQKMNATKPDSKKTENATRQCYYATHEKLPGFYGEPIFTESGSLIIPYDVINVADSLLGYNVIFTGQYSFGTAPQDWNHLFSIEPDLIPKDSFTIELGYILRSDSASECKHFFGQQLKVKSQVMLH
ncbi:MAG TPA: hypothetical protein VL443_26105 [Cyclobacteriaceae bacterium]|nr:hypothetical protein [Cyclobacteriaceae bacterium]